jgi:hypothetical protein
MGMHQEHHQSTRGLFFCLLKESLAVVDVVVGYTYMFLEKVMILVCNRIEYLVQGE